MSGGLRFTSVAAMPDGMRQAAERALHREQRLSAVPKPVEKGDARRKYRNEPITVDGMRFDSKHEARHYERLKLLRQAGEVQWFTRQVPFWLPGNIRMVVDFLVRWADGRVSVQDAKSPITSANRTYINKRKQLEALYGLDVEEV
jgi:hypothetical protein